MQMSAWASRTMAPWAGTQQEDAEPSDAPRTNSELRKDAEADQTDVAVEGFAF